MKLWGGRFSEQTNEAAHAFNSSIEFDKRLYKQDICGSIAHAQMLGKQEIISMEDSELLVKTLNEILSDIESGTLEIDLSAEDIHSFVESELVSRIGDAGRRLHTGRSRNDQVALDMRLYVKEETSSIMKLIKKLLNVLLDTAKEHKTTIMPGFTHLQKAQPITLSHHVLAYFQMFKRDYSRLSDCLDRMDECPLGAGALATTVYPIDRVFVSQRLGFTKVTENSLDSVSDRDYCVELLSALSLIMVHLSRFCEELILWSTEEYGFVSISDGYSTGSSIMPQKKNPDMAELIRGKSGRIFGDLTGLLTMLKGLPLAYNKDMQEDKEAVFDAIDTAKMSLVIFTGMISGVSYNKENMYKSANGGYTNATDAADWLVNKKGLPFREAHEIIGKLVLYAIEKKRPLLELSIDEFKAVSDVFDETIYDAIKIETSVNARDIYGGPAENAVDVAINNAAMFLGK